MKGDMARMHWQRLLASTLAAEGEVIVINAVVGALQRWPTRSESVAAHSAARALVASGKAAAGRYSANDGRGMFVVLVPAGQTPPYALSQRAIGQKEGRSQSTVSRVLRRHRHDWLRLLPG